MYMCLMRIPSFTEGSRLTLNSAQSPSPLAAQLSNQPPTQPPDQPATTLSTNWLTAHLINHQLNVSFEMITFESASEKVCINENHHPSLLNFS
jgi:hypothetical protein